jgi:hypothetical protein
VAVDRAKRVWITADDVFLVSEDGGEKWKPVEVEDHLYLRKLFYVGDNLWALGQLGLMRQDGTSVNWKLIESLVPGGSVKAYSAGSPSEE